MRSDARMPLWPGVDGGSGTTQLGLQAGQVVAHAELATMVVDDAKVHEQVRAQLFELEVIALHWQLRLGAHGRKQHLDQAAVAEGVLLDERRCKFRQRQQA